MSESRPGVYSPDKTMTGWEELIDYVRRGGEVRTHSGRVTPGDVFVAIPGTRKDGTEYIPQAIARGAAWVVVPEGEAAPATAKGVSFVYCPDVPWALGQLAKARYGSDRSGVSLVGLTGTNGKTTVSYLLEHLLGQAGKKVGIIGTISYRWPGHEQEADLTTPGCLDLHALLARMAGDGVEVVCMEVSSHALVQQRVAGLDFDLAVFTNLTQDHLDYHQDMEAYFQAKSLLFRGDKVQAVLNFDDPYGRRLAAWARPGLGYSLQGGEVAEWSCVQGRIQDLHRQGQKLSLQWSGQEMEIESGLVGRHNASNLLAALAAGLCLGLDREQLKALETFSRVDGRLQRIANSRGLNIFVDYAHTPDALDNVLSAVREVQYARLFVVFGCGGDRDARKRPLMGQAVARHADVAVLTSDNPRNEDPEHIMQAVLPGLQQCPRVEQEPDRRQAIYLALEQLGPEDVLVIAGKGHEATQEIQGQKFAFSDEQVVRDWLQAG